MKFYKYIFFVLLSFVFISCKNDSKQFQSKIEKYGSCVSNEYDGGFPKWYFTHLEEKMLLELLFEADFIDSLNLGVQKIPLKDVGIMPYHVDTTKNPTTAVRLDTIFYPNDSTAFVLFEKGISLIDKKGLGFCHSCGRIFSLAVFTKDFKRNKWCFSKFNDNLGDYGSYGGQCPYRFFKIGESKYFNKKEDIWALSIGSFYDQNFTGGVNESETWFKINKETDAEEIFSYYPMLDIGDIFVRNEYSEEAENYTIEATLDSSKLSKLYDYTMYYDIKLVKKGCTVPKGNRRDCFDFERKELYVYDNFERKYILKK